MDIILEKCVTTERKNVGRSALITGAVLTSVFALGWIWNAMFPYLFPVKKKEYVEVAVMGMGLADFGNNVNGSGDVNNMLPPSPTPGDGTPGHSDAAHEASAPVSPVVSNNPPITTNNPDAPVVQKEGPKADDHTTASSGQPDNSNQHGTGGNDTGFGSNDGDGTGIGDKGDPNAHVLNNDGTFAFEGVGSRKYIDLPRPVYTAQQEAKLTFDFIIAPDGHVKYVKGPVTQHTSLKQAGVDAIYRWKFEAAEDGKDLASKVTITFRLK